MNELFGAGAIMAITVFLVTLAILTIVLPFIIYGIRCHTKEAKKSTKQIEAYAQKVEENVQYLLNIAHALYVETEEGEE